MAGESKDVTPKLDDYFARFSVDELRQKEADFQNRLRIVNEGEKKQITKSLRRIQETIAAKLQGASGVPTGAALRERVVTSATGQPVAPTARPETGRGLVGHVVDAVRGAVSGARESRPTEQARPPVTSPSRPIEPARRGPDPAAAVRQAAADVRAAAPGTSPTAIAAAHVVTSGGGSAYAQKQAAQAGAGAGGRGPTGAWGIEAELFGDEERAA